MRYIVEMEIDPTAPAIGSAEAYVDAPPAVVWATLTDFDSWPRWNPDVKSMRVLGAIVPGTEFQWSAGGLPIRSVLGTVQPPGRIGWTGRAPPGIRAVHVWSLSPDGEGTRVHTEESFDGLIVRLLAGPARRMLSQALASGVAALKAEAERRKSG